MSAPRKLAVVPPVVPGPGAAGNETAAGDFVVDPETGYVDQVLRRRDFERRFPDAEFTFHRPGVRVTFTLAGSRVELRDPFDLGRLLDKCDAAAAEAGRA